MTSLLRTESPTEGTGQAVVEAAEVLAGVGDLHEEVPIKVDVTVILLREGTPSNPEEACQLQPQVLVDC